MRGRLAALVLFALAAAVPGGAGAAAPEVRERQALRVCADPSNLPFSDAAGQGFENKLAEMVAAELGVPVRYHWHPQTVGFVRNTLAALRCDVIMGITTTSEMVQNTNAYYRSVYTLVYRADSGLTARTLADPQLDGLRIGVVAGTPPANRLAALKRFDGVRPYHLLVDTRYDHPGRAMIEDVANGTLDVAVAWGPIGGYFAARQGVPMTVVPLTGEGDATRLDFRVSLGVRYGQDDWKHTLNDVLAKLAPQIRTLLESYDVPMLDERAQIGAVPQ
ncbi:quinoprotein dehydrogenase-associated putative ABC transporter substrate-binding protein [Azospirillum halopraeferens]|uniref:quinoprotein dehydrogenase-associated putative ABC transporter substrate-binding protein n=1 Tax=Azospirillum halopraeferens TaxID=34010 RepID=UPI00040CE50B|nr:quinoprotein dehydrogenase-associated putative ABC transporter substrate-binding protein [Azospirillum halopraeferens]